jgi:hypothetical protein
MKKFKVVPVERLGLVNVERVEDRLVDADPDSRRREVELEGWLRRWREKTASLTGPSTSRGVNKG